MNRKLTILTMLCLLLCGCTETQKWGDNPPADFTEKFGDSNPSRLLHAVIQTLDRNTKILNEAAKRILIIESDPNDLVARVEGLEVIRVLDDIPDITATGADVQTGIYKTKGTTNGIPLCPYCAKPTVRTGGGGMTTLAYYAPVYNEDGVNTNPDRDSTTYQWQCQGCDKSYSTVGNSVDGFNYVLEVSTSNPAIKAEVMK